MEGMVFSSFAQASTALLGSMFVIAFILGAVINKTHFCTLGAVSDWVNMGDLGRMRSWLLAIALAMIGVMLLESLGSLNADTSFPPYRRSGLDWVENLLGGLMFGVGMSLAGGCANKTLVRLGAGNLKSLVVLIIMAMVAYFMINPFPGTSHTLYSLVFRPWTAPLTLELGHPQDLGALVAGPEHAATARMFITPALVLALLIFIFMSRSFRQSFNNVLGGITVGLAVVAAWYLTSSVRVDDAMGGLHSLMAYVQDWDFLADDPAGRPLAAMPWAAQSFTFVNPMSQTLRYGVSGFEHALLYLGVVVLVGVVLGSMCWALLSRSFRIEWFASRRDFVNHCVGALLMALGGALAMGCTIGQGVTGLSTLALGGFITFISIVIGAAMSMKIQYYYLVYEDDASLTGALLSSLVDFRLLPRKFRRLDAV